MSESTVTLTEFKQQLGEIINRAAYGDERIILMARGKPRAALISLKDLERLYLLEEIDSDKDKLAQQLALLAQMDKLRQRMMRVNKEIDSNNILNEVREERLDDLMGLS